MSDQQEDPLLHGLMQETFGPPEGAPVEENRVGRGLEEVESLSRVGAGGGVTFFHQSTEEPAEPPPPLAEEKVCFRCGAANPRASCAKCGVARYCGRECQVADWGKHGAFGGHKFLCAGYKQLGAMQMVPSEARRATIEQLLSQIRLYLCPFALCHASAALAAGTTEHDKASCVLMQSPCTLAQLALPCPRDCAGHAIEERAIFLHHVTLAEFDAELAARDERLASLRPHVASASLDVDITREVPVVVRVACGYCAVVRVPLVPEHRVCLALASEYESRTALQLNLDDK